MNVLQRHGTTHLLAGYTRISDEWSTRNRWRDGKLGLVHQLLPYVTEASTIDWKPACGYPRRSHKPSAFAGPITCLFCAGFLC